MFPYLYLSEFFNRPSVKLTLILIVVIVFFLVVWKVLLWIEKKLNQYEKSRTKRKSRRNLKKPNPIFTGIYKKPGMFQRIFQKNGKTDRSFFQSKRFGKENNEEEKEREEDMDTVGDIPSQEDLKSFDESSEMSHDIQYPSNQKIPKVMENKAKEVMKNQRDQTKRKVKKSSFSEDPEILGLR